MAMSKEEFRRRWNSGPDGGGITCDDCADCYVAWGLGDAPRTKPIANVITSVCAAAGCDEAVGESMKDGALREALVGVLSALEDAGFHLFVYGDPLAEAVIKARAALAAPPRNYDLCEDWLALYVNFRPPKGMREMPPEWVDAVAAFCKWLKAEGKEAARD